ncbi:MAG: hypothetical protein JW751_03110 [Polyangiaceae bacterium]|nr:hypothetical protein [Polyangiaceae bacterium]
MVAKRVSERVMARAESWWGFKRSATVGLVTAGSVAVALLNGGCKASLEPRVEEGTVAVGVVYKEEFHASRGAHTRAAFGNSPPHLQVLVEETQVGSVGKFSLDLRQEGLVEGTMVLGDRTLDVIDVSPFEKAGRATTMLLTVAQRDASTRVVPAEIMTVGWQDRGRWFRRFGKPLVRADARDRLYDLATVKAEFHAAMAQELPAAAIQETPNGFKVTHGGRETFVDLQSLVEVTGQGQARMVVHRLAELARFAVEGGTGAGSEAASPEAASPEAASPEAASPEAASSGGTNSEPQSSEAAAPLGKAGSVLCALRPEGPFSALSRAERESLLWETVAPGIVCVYVAYQPGSVSVISAGELSGLGVGRAALSRLAAKNLYESMGPIYRIDVGRGVYIISTAGFFDASLLLVPEVWAEVDPLLAGDRVVAVPDQDTLLVTGANNTAGMEVLQAAAAEAGGSDQPVAGHLLIWRSGKYERSRVR